MKTSTSRYLLGLAAALLPAFPVRGGYMLAQTSSLPATLHLADPKVIAAGETLFAKNCSVGYCHGVAGRAGRGPRLRGREWDKDYLFKVTFEGIPNSSMPAWRGRLSETEVGSIVAYILTLSKATSDGADAVATPVLPKTDAANTTPQLISPATQKPVSFGLTGDPGKGRALFFDSSNDLNCGICHKIGGSGGEVGPDLSQHRQKPAREILKDIVLPTAVLSPKWQLLSVTRKTGEEIQGIRVEESLTHLKIYDVESLPPVLRTLAKEDIQKQQVESRSAMPGKYGELYTLKELLDLIAFIKQDATGASQVSVEDLF